jgi:hypothetical protein
MHGILQTESVTRTKAPTMAGRGQPKGKKMQLEVFADNNIIDVRDKVNDWLTINEHDIEIVSLTPSRLGKNFIMTLLFKRLEQF